MSKPRYRWLSGDVNPVSYGGKWWRPFYYQGELDTIAIMELHRWEDEAPATYNVTVRSITLSLYSDMDKASAASCWGITMEEFLALAPQYQAEIMANFGFGDVTFYKNGDNYRKLLREARNH